MNDEGLRDGDGDLIDREHLSGVQPWPARDSILEVLSIDGGRELSPAEMAVELGMGLNGVDYHVRVLAETGHLQLVGRDRPEQGARERFYRLNVLPSQGATQRPMTRP
jgi:predicted ArsR family transcriptional regulator